ncbi:MAG: winged helix-turn-helix transcriptional regulator [Candidatus Nanoarchaeia archaeon]
METTKLDLIDKKILTELDKNCRIPNSILAKKVGRSREAVKYRIEQLVEKGIITNFITSINPNKMGYYMFKVYLQLENIPEEREKFYEYLKTQKSVYWMGISDGAFDCVFAILAKDIVEYYKLINKILHQFKELIVRKVLGTMVDTHQYNKKFFINDKNGNYVIFGGEKVDNKLDSVDKKLLDILANDARIPITELAKKAESTVEIIRRKIKNLEEKGIILGYRISIDLNKLGYEFFKAIIYFKSLSSENEKALFEWMRTNPSSVYYIRSLTSWEAEFEFVVENYLQFNSIINNLRKTFPTVISHCEHLIMIYEVWMPAYKELFK